MQNYIYINSSTSFHLMSDNTNIDNFFPSEFILKTFYKIPLILNIVPKINYRFFREECQINSSAWIQYNNIFNVISTCHLGE